MSKEASNREQAEKEQIEVADAEAAIADMDNKRRLKDERKENLLAQIEEVKLAIEKKRASTSSYSRSNRRS